MIRRDRCPAERRYVALVPLLLTVAACASAVADPGADRRRGAASYVIDGSRLGAGVPLWVSLSDHIPGMRVFDTAGGCPAVTLRRGRRASPVAAPLIRRRDPDPRDLRSGGHHAVERGQGRNLSWRRIPTPRIPDSRHRADPDLPATRMNGAGRAGGAHQGRALAPGACRLPTRPRPLPPVALDAARSVHLILPPLDGLG